MHPDEFDRLLAQARDTRGVDLPVTHTPPASVVDAMLRTGPPEEAVLHPAALRGPGPTADTPSSVRVEQAWCVIGQPPLVCGHMRRPWREGVVEVLAFTGVTLRTLWQGQIRRPGGIR